MAKRRKQTKTQKRIANLLKSVSRLEKRGYFFEDNIRAEIKQLSPQKARFFSLEKLYGRAKYVVPEGYNRGEYGQGEIVSGTAGRQIEREIAALKAAETRRKKKQQDEEIPPYRQDDGEPTDYDEDMLQNFRELIWFITNQIPEVGRPQSLGGQEVPKTPDLFHYGESVRQYIARIFEEEKAKNPGALAERLYMNSDVIDEVVGVIEYSMYKESIRLAGNTLISIIRGTSKLSERDFRVSEMLANIAGEGVENEP